MEFIQGRVWAEKGLGVVVSASRVVGSWLCEVECAGECSFGKKNCVVGGMAKRRDTETLENSHVSDVGGREGSI